MHLRCRAPQHGNGADEPCCGPTMKALVLVKMTRHNGEKFTHRGPKSRWRRRRLQVRRNSRRIAPLQVTPRQCPSRFPRFLSIFRHFKASCTTPWWPPRSALSRLRPMHRPLRCRLNQPPASARRHHFVLLPPVPCARSPHTMSLMRSKRDRKAPERLGAFASAPEAEVSFWALPWPARCRSGAA